MKCSGCYAMINALKKARIYWYGLQLDFKQACLFQKGLNLLIAAAESILGNDESKIKPREEL